MSDIQNEKNIKSEIESSVQDQAGGKEPDEKKEEKPIPPFVTSCLKLKRGLLDKAVSIFLLLIGIYLGCLIFIVLPTKPEIGILLRTFGMTLFVGLFLWLMKRLVVFWVKDGTSLFKAGVENRISAADLRKRWDREVGHDFLNVIFETRLKVFLRSERNPERALIARSFYSQFMPDKERIAILFNEGCFFDLDEVHRAEEACPRLKPVDYASIEALRSKVDELQNELEMELRLKAELPEVNVEAFDLKIKELEKELEDARTLKARLTKSEKKLEGARKEGFFFANMILEMVADPTAKKQFPHKEYKAIADKVITKDYIQKLEMVRPANSVIEEFRENLPAEFRHEGNKPK
ncbi:hypothetical protein [Desulfovibrio sp. JC010]|uniref:hypothetical protein n=1 Tax=Desulfovibrio sp. JC010 TaxID=2593641 RepID=UPI0013D2A798|nr:hypothetical protein [Desulfovibrio sp. JC010]NDV28150.1 hypothetical protein [Desulfovibrio sp. JC010]